MRCFCCVILTIIILLCVTLCIITCSDEKASTDAAADADADADADEEEPGSGSAFDLSDDDEETADISKEYPPAPKGWFFPGFFAFVLFGPHSTYSSVLLKVSADDERSESEGAGSRKQILAAAAARERNKRQNGILGGGRGANLSEKMEMARLAQVEDAANQRHLDSAIVAFQLQLQSIQEDTKTILTLISQLPKKSPLFETYIEKIEANRTKAEEINSQLYDLTTKPRVQSSVAAAVIGEAESLLGVPPTKKARTDESDEEDMPPIGEDSNRVAV